MLVHGVESVLPVECEIPSLKLSIELFSDTYALKEQLFHLKQLDEQHRYSSMEIEVNEWCFKA